MEARTGIRKWLGPHHRIGMSCQGLLGGRWPGESFELGNSGTKQHRLDVASKEAGKVRCFFMIALCHQHADRGSALCWMEAPGIDVKRMLDRRLG